MSVQGRAVFFPNRSVSVALQHLRSLAGARLCAYPPLPTSPTPPQPLLRAPPPPVPLPAHGLCLQIIVCQLLFLVGIDAPSLLPSFCTLCLSSLSPDWSYPPHTPSSETASHFSLVALYVTCPLELFPILLLSRAQPFLSPWPFPAVCSFLVPERPSLFPCHDQVAYLSEFFLAADPIERRFCLESPCEPPDRPSIAGIPALVTAAANLCVRRGFDVAWPLFARFGTFQRGLPDQIPATIQPDRIRCPYQSA